MVVVEREKSSASGVIVAIVAIVVLAIIGYMAYGYFVGNGTTEAPTTNINVTTPEVPTTNGQ